MKLFLMLLVFECVSTHLIPIYKKDLRNMHGLEKNKIIDQLILEEFTRISQNIVEEAKIGKNESQFNLRCQYRFILNGECVVNKDDEFLVNNQNNQFKIPHKYYRHILLQKLNQTFPDSNIVQLNRLCCLYMISW